MQKTFLLLIISLQFSFISQPCLIKTEGIYTASVNVDTDAHIRFYTDGLVIVSTSVKEFKDVKTWFHKDNVARILKGKYKVKKARIKFSVKGETGEQKFEGTVGCDEITVTITDAKTKASTLRIYKFLPL